MLFFRRTVAVAALLFLLVARLDAARPFPETVYDSLNNRSIFIFSDQLGSISEGEAQFAATHYVGCQKMPRASIDRIRMG